MCCVLASMPAAIVAAKQAIMPVQNMLVQKNAWRGMQGPWARRSGVAGQDRDARAGCPERAGAPQGARLLLWFSEVIITGLRRRPSDDLSYRGPP